MKPLQCHKKAGIAWALALASLLLFTVSGWSSPGFEYEQRDQAAEQKQYMIKLADDDHKVDLAIQSTKTLIDQSKGRPYLSELYLRLAELYIEKSRLIYFIRKNQISDNLAGLKQLESKNLKIRAIEIYQHILDEFPDFEHRDKALFFMAHEYRELGMMDEMVTNYRSIIKQYKKSRYVPECYLLLGDDFNNKGDLASAKKHYTAVLNYPQSPAITIARYKLAWCHINEKGFKDAIELFEHCVLGDTKGDLDIDTYKRVDIKLEALIDIAYCYPESYKKTPPIAAIAYFKKLAWSRPVYTAVLEKLAYRYYIKQRWRHAAVVYRELCGLQYDPEKLLEYARNTFECVQKLKTFEDADRDMAHIIKALKMQAYSVHIPETEKKKNHTDYELYARNIVTLLHENARRKKSVESFKRASDGYAQYLDFFTESPVLREMAVNYAEALFSSQQYFEAGRQYEKVALADAPDKTADQTLLYSAVISYYRALKGNTPLTYYQKAYTRDGLRTTGNQYASLYPDADQVPHVLFNVAWIAYDEGRYDQAIDEFTEFIQRYPTGETTAAAIHLALKAYHQTEDYEGLVKFGNRVLARPPVEDPQFKTEVAGIVAASESKIISSLTVAAVNDWDQGREDLEAFAQSNRQTQLGEQALNALLISGKERHEIETVYTTGSQLMEQYPDSGHREATMGILIDTFLNVAQFRMLAAYLEQYARHYPGNKNSRDFFYQAGQIRELLGHHQQSNRDYAGYLKLASKKDPHKDAVVFSMAENALAVQDVDTAIKLLTRHRKNLSAASKIRADARLADLSLQAGYAKQAMAYRKRAYRAYSAGLAKEDAALRAAVARMVFNAVDRSYKRYMHIALSKKIDNSVVQEKAKLLEKLEKGYHEVVQYHSPHWTLAALSRSFDINREFALFIENAPMPDLSGDQKAQYRELLAQKAASYMDKAQKYRSASVSQARKWKACDSSLTAYLIDGDGSNGHPGQALPFSPSAATTEVAERFIEIDSLKTLHEKLMQDPDDLQALSSLAAAYLDTRDFKHAALVAKKLLESVKPEQKTVMATAYNLLGMAHLFDGNDPAAQDAFQRALSEEPGHTGAKINLAGLYKHYGYRRDAEKLYQSVSEASVDMQADPSIHPRAKELFYENNKLAKN